MRLRVYLHPAIIERLDELLLDELKYQEKENMIGCYDKARLPFYLLRTPVGCGRKAK